MKRATILTVAFAAALSLVIPAAANAAGPPPPPTAVSGKKVNVWATGVAIPTQFAFAGKDVFIAGGAEGKIKGGLYVRKPGSKVAKKVPGSPAAAFGVVIKDHKVYVSAGKSILVYGKWTGKKFKKKKVLFKPKAKNFSGFNGLAIGPNGRLYAGISLGAGGDHAKATGKYGNSVISMRRNGTDVKTVSKGLRQPWQLAFTKGDKSPTVTELGQDSPKGTKAPDLLVKAKLGANFGFPTCTWESAAKCAGFTKPLLIFPAPTDGSESPSPTGIAAKGKTLYVALFGSALVVRTDSTGAKPKTVLKGFVAPVVGVASHKGFLYAGDLTGQIYRVHD